MPRPKDGTLIALFRARLSAVARGHAPLREVRRPRTEGARGPESELAPAKERVAAREREDVKGVRGDLIRRAPIPRLGLNQPTLAAIWPLQRPQEGEPPSERRRKDWVGRIAAQEPQRFKQEARHSRLVERGDVRAPRVLTAPLCWVVGISTVRELNALQNTDRLDRGALELFVSLQGVRARQPHEPPSSLRGDPLVEHGVAEVGARVTEARLSEGLPI